MRHISQLLDEPPPPARSRRVSTGHRDLDEVTGGLRPGQVWLVTGTPGQGRTTLLTQWAGRLAVEFTWTAWLVCPAEEPHDCASRLAASVGRVPLLALMTGQEDDGDAPRIDAARDRLRRARLWIHAGPQVQGLPNVQEDASPMVVAADDADLLGVEPRLLRRVADSGALVVASLPRHLLTGPEGDLDPRWAQIADCIVEVRIHGHGLDEWPRLGEAELTVLKNRRGPLAVVSVAFQGHYARFVDLASPASPA